MVTNHAQILEMQTMSQTSTIQYIDPEGTGPAQGLYSHVTRVPADKTLYFVAGQLSVARDGSIVGKHDFEAQFKQVFDNLRDVLTGLGEDFNSVVKFTTMFVHSQDIEKFMKLRAELFPTLFATPMFPPNTIFVIDRLVKEDFLLEVEAVVAASKKG